MLKERKPPQRRLTSAESDPGFGFRSGYRSQNVVDSLSASVISPSAVKIGQWLYEKIYGNKFPNTPYSSCSSEGSGKVIWNPYPEPDNHQRLNIYSDW